MKRKIVLYLTLALIISAVVAATGMNLSANPVPEKRVDRISGNNRFGTAVAISKEGWETSDCVVLARGDEFADALAGVPLAYSLDAPILLTHSNRLVDSIRQEIIDLQAKTVIILGGEGAISKAVEDDLRNMGLTIDRIRGSNRYDTAGLIAKRMKAASTYKGKIIVASGSDFPDALSASAYAARLGYPIILCPNNRIPSASQSAIDELNPEAAYVVGGTAVINDEVMDKLPSPKRVSGKNRYGTATALAEEFKPGNVRYFVATGLDFADAVAGGVLAAKNDAGLLLVSRTVLPAVVEYIANYPVRLATIFGGPGAVSEETEIELEKLLDSAVLAQAIVAAQAAIDALPEQVAASEDSTEAQGYVDAAQDLIDAVLDSDPDYDTSRWDAVIAEQQAIVDAMKALEEAVSAAQGAIDDLPAQVAAAENPTEAQGYIDVAQTLIDAVLALDPDYVTTAWDAVIAEQQTNVDAIKAVDEATNKLETAVNALNRDGTDNQATIDMAWAMHDLIADMADLLPECTVKASINSRLAAIMLNITVAQEVLDAVNAATAAVEAAENAADALAGNGTDTQAAIYAAQGLYDDAVALVAVLPDGDIMTGLEEILALVQADIAAAQAALNAVIEATAAVVAAEDAANALAKDGTDTQAAIDAAKNLYDAAAALVGALPEGAIKSALEARLAQVQADIDAAQETLDAVIAATAAVEDAENAASALAKDGTDTQAAIDAAKNLYDAAAALVGALPEGAIKTALEARLTQVQADIDAAQETLDAVIAGTAAVEDAENAANALAKDGTDTQAAIDAAKNLYDAAAALVGALPEGAIKTALEARLAQVQADIDAAQEILDAVNAATAAVEDAENAAGALAKDGTDTQAAIDAAQNLYDAAAALVNALPDGDIKTTLQARLTQIQADIDAVQTALDAANAATAAVVAAENAANALAGNGSDTQAAIDSAQDLYDDAAALVNALPDGEIKTGLEERLALVQADIDSAQAALDAVNAATAAVEAAENAAGALAGDGSDTQAAIDAAKDRYDAASFLVHVLPDGEIKTALEARLAQVKADIDAAQTALDAANAATAAVETAENAAGALAKDGTDTQAAIDGARKLYDAAVALVDELLNGSLKTALVARLSLVQSDIDDAQKALDFLKAIQEVEAMITALPSVDELVLSDYIEVQAARAAYEALSEEQQGLVSNLATLAAAEDKIAELVLADIDNRINTVIPQLNLEGTGIAGITYADKHAVFTISDLNIDIINFADSGVLDLFLEMFRDVKTAEIDGQVINLEGMSKAELKTAVGQYLIYPLIEGGESRDLIELVGKSAEADLTIQLGSASYKATYSVEFVAATFNLTTAAENGSAEGAGIYAVGSEVTLTATADTDYAFYNWADEAGNEVSTDNPFIFNMVNRDLTVTANFVKTEAAVLADVDSRIVDAIANLNLAGTGIIEVAYENRLATFLIDDAQESISAFAGSGVFNLFLEMFSDVVNADIYLGAELVGTIGSPGSMTVGDLRSAVLENLIIPLVGEGESMTLKDLAGKNASAEITFSAGFVQYTAVFTVRFQLTDRAIANEVTALINVLLPLEELAFAEKEAVEFARAAYDDLTQVQQGLVSNLDILIAAEARITKLELLEQAKITAAGKVEAEYTILSWNGLSAALALPEATISDIEAKTTAIWDAIENLVRKADLTAYNAALEAVNEADYSAESWQAYQEVVAANTVTPENTQDEADAATAAIIAAQADLVREFPSGLTRNSDIVDFINDQAYPWRHDYSISDRVAYYPTNQGVGSSKSAFTFKVPGPGVLTYEYKVSAEDNWDYLKIYVDGRLVKEHKASTDWTSDLLKLSKTSQIVKFEYKKDSSNDRKDDKVWVANLDLFTGDKNLVIAVNGAMHGSVNASADGASLSLGTNVIPAGAEIAFSATANTGAAFYGWVDEDGNLLSTSSDYGFTLLTDRTVVAVFAPAGTYVVRRDGEFYSEADGGLAAALNDAVSGNTIFLLENTVLSESAAVPGGATLMVPYRASETSPTELGTASTATGRVSWTNEAKYLYLTLTIPEGVTLNIDGNVTVGAVCSHPSQMYQGHTSGAYSQIICDGTINVNGQGVLDLYGLLKGSGAVTAFEGATLYQPFMIADFAGGTNTYDLFNLNQTPFKRYGMVNIQTDLVMHYGATLYGHASLYFWESITTLDAEFIGPNGLIIPSEGATLTSTYDSTKYVNHALAGNNLNPDIGKTTIMISGGAKSGFMTYPYGIVTSGVYFSIPYNYDIVLENGDYNFAYAYKLMPGASLWVKDTATLEVTSGFYVYDGLIQSDMSGKSYPTTAMLQEHGFSPSANFIVDGTFIVRSGKTFGGIIQTNGGGQIILEENSNVINEAVTDGGKTKYDANSSIFALSGRIYDVNTGALITIEAGNTYTGQTTAENWLLSAFRATYAFNSTSEDYSEDISNPSYPHYHRWMTSTLVINQPMTGAWYKQ